MRSETAVSAAARVARWQILSAEEQAKAESFRAEEHRAAYVDSHAALRSILGCYLRVEAADVPLLMGSGDGAGTSKPSLAPQTNPNDLRFNLSHTHGAALVGVTLGRELGVDIEFRRPIEDLEEMARSVMSSEELGHWLALGDGERVSAFYHLWTRKESYLKATGVGLYGILKEITVPVSVSILDGVGGEACRVRDDAGGGLWMVTDIVAGEDISASVCFEGPSEPDIAVFDLDWAAKDGVGAGL